MWNDSAVGVSEFVDYSYIKYATDIRNNAFIDDLVKRQRMRLISETLSSIADKRHYTLRFVTERDERPPIGFEIRTRLDISEVQYQNVRMADIQYYPTHTVATVSAKIEIPKEWRCVYCGHMQYPTSRKCQDCGGPKLS